MQNIDSEINLISYVISKITFSTLHVTLVLNVFIHEMFTLELITIFSLYTRSTMYIRFELKLSKI